MYKTLYVLCCPAFSPQITGYAIDDVLDVTVNVSLQTPVVASSCEFVGPSILNVSKSNLNQQISINYRSYLVIIAQCVYRKSYAYMMKIPMAYHEAPTTKFRLF